MDFSFSTKLCCFYETGLADVEHGITRMYITYNKSHGRVNYKAIIKCKITFLWHVMFPYILNSMRYP